MTRRALVEGSDHVLAERWLRDLSANRTVHLRLAGVVAVASAMPRR